MMFVWRERSFDASHTLPNLPEWHQCRRLHGHTYTVRATVTGGTPEWVMDLGILKAEMDRVVSALDHRHLNDIAGLENPTSENVAQWIYKRLVALLPAAITLAEVEVRESPHSGAIYRPDR